MPANSSYFPSKSSEKRNISLKNEYSTKGTEQACAFGKANYVETILDTSWVPLNNGWYQISPDKSGTFTRCGQHTLIENSISGIRYCCVYMPRTKDLISSLSSESSQYDISLSLKYFNSTSSSQPVKGGIFEILFGYKSKRDYFSFTIDLGDNSWCLTTTKDDDVLHIVQSDEKYPLTVFPNLFYSIIIKIRSGSVSCDFDSRNLFDLSLNTASANGHNLDFRGLIGLSALVTSPKLIITHVI